MSHISALDGIYNLGIKSERARVREALASHLGEVHGWNNDAIETVFTDLGLDTDPWLDFVQPHCVICGEKQGTQVIHQQTLHNECAETLSKTATMILTEE